MKTKEIAALSPEEIRTKVREARGSLLNQNLRKQTGQIEKTHELRNLRKEIARLETVLRQKSLKPATAS